MTAPILRSAPLGGEGKVAFLALVTPGCRKHTVVTPIPQGPSGRWSCKAKLADDTDYAELSLDGETVRSTRNAGDVKGAFRDGGLRLALKTNSESYALAGELKEEKLNGTWRNLTDLAYCQFF